MQLEVGKKTKKNYITTLTNSLTTEETANGKRLEHIWQMFLCFLLGVSVHLHLYRQTHLRNHI